jgi:hypothetical protein
MKTNDIKDVQYTISDSNFENVFNVYEDKESEKYFYNLLKTVIIPEDLDEEYFDYYAVKFGDMWPTISYKFYNDVTLWWVICSTNQITDATKNPEVGKLIKIIKPRYLPEILNQIN